MFKEYEASVDPSCLNVSIEEEQAVWKEITVGGVNLIRDHKNGNIVYAQLEVECSWDAEHGMQFIYRNGNVLIRVSAEDGNYFLSDMPALS